MRSAALLLLPGLLLAGCIRAPGGAEEAWRFRGTFTGDFTDGDVRAVCEAARVHECGMMESLPPQYGFVYPSRAECEAARARVLAVPHVAGVTACAPQA